MRIPRPLSFGIAFLVVGCMGEEPEWAGTVTDSAGVAIVANPADGLWDDVDRWTLEEELRIGSIQDDPEYQFGIVQGVAVGDDSRIYVLDRLAHHVKVFSPDGRLVRIVGGPGEGPGELGRFPSFLAVLSGDTLIVNDAPSRINRYTPDGIALGSIRVDMREGVPLAWRVAATGALAFQSRRMGSRGNTVGQELPDAIVRFDSDRLFGDTLLRVPRGETTLGGGLAVYPREPVWTITGDLDVVYGVNHEYRLGVYSGGSLSRVITKVYEPRPVTAQEREAVISAVQRAQLAGGRDAAAVAGLRERIRFADFVPPVSSIFIGPEGTLWVSSVVTFSTLSEEDQENYTYTSDWSGPEWDVFDREGRFLGQVTMPERFTPHVFKDDRMYGVVRGEFDVQYVVRLRIVRPGAA